MLRKFDSPQKDIQIPTDLELLQWLIWSNIFAVDKKFVRACFAKIRLVSSLSLASLNFFIFSFRSSCKGMEILMAFEIFTSIFQYELSIGIPKKSCHCWARFKRIRLTSKRGILWNSIFLCGCSILSFSSTNCT